MTNLSVYKGVLQIKQALKSMEIGVSFKATEDTKSPVAIFTMIKSDGVGIWFNKDLVSKDDEVKILARSKRNKQLLIYVKQYTYAVKDMQQPIKNWTLTQQIQKEHYALISLTQGSPTVSLLPKRATSLSEANELLMPKALKGVEGAIKQGAFFFVPVTKADYKAMASSYQKSHNMKFHRWELQNSLGTEHTPEQHFYTNDTEYVSCRVYRGKSSVFLEGWYKVVPDLSLKELLGD